MMQQWFDWMFLGIMTFFVFGVLCLAGWGRFPLLTSMFLLSGMAGSLSLVATALLWEVCDE